MRKRFEIFSTRLRKTILTPSLPNCAHSKPAAPEKFPDVWAAAKELSKLLKRQGETLAQFDPNSSLKPSGKTSRAIAAIGSLLGIGALMYGINHYFRSPNSQETEPETDSSDTNSPASSEVPSEEPICPLKKPLFLTDASTAISDKQRSGEVTQGLSLKTAFSSIGNTGHRMFGFTLSDLSFLLSSLEGKKIPSSLAPFIATLHSLLKESSLQSPSSHPLILVALNQKETDDLRSLLENEPFSPSLFRPGCGKRFSPGTKREANYRSDPYL